ncbi:MAG: alpha/beta fold hydrolase [Candidatus Omnitrophota bacterium]|nr:alpha/beta fold hydrolase [Candidatus Omnitrophota bacterium]
MDKKMGIMYRHWKASEPGAVFLLVHGLGAHSGRWEFLSDFFLQNNVSSYALELKGFGETEELKGHIDSFDVYFNDIHALRGMIVKEDPGKKVFLLGESLGALISFLMVIKEPDLFDGLICISPAFASKLKIPFSQYVKTFFSLIYDPEKQFQVPFNSQMCTRDMDYQKVMDSDAREHRLITSKLILEAVVAQARSGILKGKVSVSVLFLLSGEDKLTDPEASKRIYTGLKIKDKSLIEYPGMYHSLSIDLGREQVFEDILKWTQERI